MRLLPDPILRMQAKKVGSLQKVAVIETPEMEEPLVLINPEIMKKEGEREVVEG
jgi:peptide deformylase